MMSSRFQTILCTFILIAFIASSVVHSGPAGVVSHNPMVPIGTGSFGGGMSAGMGMPTGSGMGMGISLPWAQKPEEQELQQRYMDILFPNSDGDSEPRYALSGEQIDALYTLKDQAESFPQLQNVIDYAVEYDSQVSRQLAPLGAEYRALSQRYSEEGQLADYYALGGVANKYYYTQQSLMTQFYLSPQYKEIMDSSMELNQKNSPQPLIVQQTIVMDHGQAEQVFIMQDRGKWNGLPMSVALSLQERYPDLFRIVMNVKITKEKEPWRRKQWWGYDPAAVKSLIEKIEPQDKKARVVRGLMVQAYMNCNPAVFEGLLLAGYTVDEDIKKFIAGAAGEEEPCAQKFRDSLINSLVAHMQASQEVPDPADQACIDCAVVAEVSTFNKPVIFAPEFRMDLNQRPKKNKSKTPSLQNPWQGVSSPLFQ